MTGRAGLRPWWAAAVLLTVVLVAPALLAELASGGRIPMMNLLSDPTEVTGLPWHVGAVSSLNTFIWAGAALLGWDLTARRVAEEAASMLGAVAWMLFPAGIAVRHLRGLPRSGARSGKATGDRAATRP